jgi:hypothetical protein
MNVMYRTAPPAAVLAALTLVSAVLFTPTNCAANPAEDEKDKAARPARIGGFELSGFLDTYFQHDFNRSSLTNNLGNSGRLFDVKNDSLTLAAARLTVVKPVTERDPVGLTAQLLFGPNADLLHIYDTGGVDRYKNLQQVYGTYRGRGDRPLTVDVGKFAAWIGYEGLDSIDNENYSRAFNFNLGQPNYTAGVRVTKPLTSTLNATLFIVNGYNETEDGNGGKTLGAQMSRSAGRSTVTLGWWGGPEGGETKNAAGGFGGINFAAPGVLNLNIGNLIASYNVSDRTRVVFDGYYANAASDDRSGGSWNGQALYLRHHLSESRAAALRLERMDDTRALRTGARRKLHSATATYQYRIGESLLNRLELRQDWSSDPYFGSDRGHKDARTTFTFAAAYLF